MSRSRLRLAFNAVMWWFPHGRVWLEEMFSFSSYYDEFAEEVLWGDRPLITTHTLQLS